MPERVLEDGLAVRFVEERGGAQKVYDFSALPVAPAVREWLVAAFVLRISPPAAMKRIRAVDPTYWTVRRIADLLATADPPVRSAADVTVAHVDAFRATYAGLRSQHAYMDWLRSLLRDDPQLAPEVRAALVTGRTAPPGEPSRARPAEYSELEWQQITTALRRTVRLARDRVQSARQLLARHRASPLPTGERDALLAAVLDVFDRTGDVPRTAQGNPTTAVRTVGGVRRVTALLCLSVEEVAGFALLLTAMTGQNFGTVAAWPAVAYRPDGGLPDGPALALLETCKPRRGPDREHMLTPLEDAPPSLADVVAGDDSEPRLFRSPLRVYELLLELSEVARRHSGHPGAFAGHTASPNAGCDHWVRTPTSEHVCLWARRNGFPTARAAQEGGLPPVDVRWLRATSLQRDRRPVAHTHTTLRDKYLMRSDQVIGESRIVVADALRDEVAKARARQAVPVFTAAFLDRVQTDPSAAAAEAGVSADTLAALVSGRNDTVFTACTNHRASPHAEPGTPCPASFLECLHCANARALPHHLPVQIITADHIAALRPHLDPAVWNARYAPVLDQLTEILGRFSPAERDQARQAATAAQRQMVGELLAGRWDLR